MYGQANYGSQFGQGPQKPLPPAYQQRAVAPPPPTSYLQQGPAIPLHPITQQAPVPPPQVAQPLHLSQSGSHAPPPPLCQGPSIQVLSGGITNIHQTYFHTFQPVHGSTQVPQFNSNAPQNVQLPHSGIQNLHHISPLPPPPPRTPNPDLLRPPQPSTVVTVHPPLQGQALCGARAHPPMQQGGLQVLPSIPQHPSTSNFPTSFVGVMQSNLGESHLHSMAPPPPPSSPPPVPPAPPPPTSPPSSLIPNPDSSSLLCQSDFDPSSIIHSSLELKAMESSEGVMASCYVGNNSPKHDEQGNAEGYIGHKLGSKVENDILPNKDDLQDLPPSPPKPKEDKIVRKIEEFCQLIENNGSNYEDTTRQNEFGNPEFEFLFGGEPGSEAAIGHEYFLWMKKKYSLACKNKEMKEKSPLRSLRIEPQSEYLMVSAGSISPANSDMEMEDDITPAYTSEGVRHSFEIQNYECKSRDEEHDIKQQLQEPEDLQKCAPAKGNAVEDGGTKVLLDHEKSPSIAAPQVSSPGIVRQPLGSSFEISVTCLPNDGRLAGVVAPSETLNSSQSSPLITGGSPFRLIQDYASDENSENDDESHLKDISFAIASSASAQTSHEDTDNLTTYVGSKGPCQVQPGFNAPVEASMSDPGAKFLSESQKRVNHASVANFRSGMENEQSDNKQGSQVGTSASSYKSLDAMNGCSVDVLNEGDKLQKENEDKFKLELSPAKIDEFGRLVREGGSDSDSDDSYYTRRRKNRRIRSSSHSHSPMDRRQGRRSPWRRRERRSRSRSRSPWNQRGRSRSPVSRRTSQFNNENTRREKGLMRRCFDFQRGRCYRGASCRYMHHEPSKKDGSRLHRSKQHHDVHPTSKDIRIREETEDMSMEVSDLVHSEVKNQEFFHHNVSSKDSTDWKMDSPNGDPDSDATKCRSFKDRADSVLEDEIIYSKPAAASHIHVNENDQEAEKSCHQLSVIAVASQCMSNADTVFSGDISTSMLASSKNSMVQQPNSVAELQAADSSLHQMDDFSVSNLLPDQVIAITTNKSPEREPFPNKTSSIKPQFDTSSASQLPSSTQFLSQSLVPKPLYVPAPGHSVGDAHPLPELPPPPPLIISHVASAEVPMPVACNFVPQNMSFTSQSSLPGSFHPHDFSPIQPSHYPGTSFPPPKPIYDLTLTPVTTKYSTPMQFQQTHLSQGSDLGSQSAVKSQPLELHANSQVGESPVQEPCRTPPMHIDQLRSIAPAANNRPIQPFGVPSIQKEENFARTSVELNSSSFFPHGNLNAHSMPFTTGLSSNRMQSSGDSFPPSEFRSSFSQFHPYSRFQQPLYASQQPAYDSLLRGPGQIGSISRHFPDPLSRNQSSLLPDFGGLGISTYHNPYASTFEKPLSSNFRSNVLKLGNDAPSGDVLNSTFSLSNVQVEGQGADCVGSRQITASPNSSRPLGKLLPSSGGDQYDPLFDSIEPSPPIIKKSDVGRKLEKTRESHMMTRLSGSHKPLDVEENSKHKEVAAVASTTSLENDEFGETADGEAGAVENDLIDEANLTGEIEIDQVKSPGKSKTSKGSRSLRLFKIAIADFVKEVLKPSWRQGNMSKEAFKTIVKKTVDKVAGAMKSHQIPKSQAKINRYIDSSQRKLTKLVMGYVDKYVKA